MQAGGLADNALAERLQGVLSLSLPPAAGLVFAAAERLTAAQRRIAELTGTAAEDARRLAGTAHHGAGNSDAGHQGGPCPVCGGRVLDDTWATSMSEEIERLTRVAAEAHAAHTELTAAIRALRNLIPAEPAALSADLRGEADAAPTKDAWQRWTILAAEGSPEDLATDATELSAALRTALGKTQAQAREALRKRSEDWQPVAAAMAAWVSQARISQRATIALASLKKAIAWLRETGKDVRNARLEPLAEVSSRVWEMLRQESNVEPAHPPGRNGDPEAG